MVVIQSGRLTRRQVTIGAIGGSSTQITSSGTSVVLTDLLEAVPSSSTSSSTGSFGGSGFSGSGGPSGGAGTGAGGDS